MAEKSGAPGCLDLVTSQWFVTISNKNGTERLGGLTEFNQYRSRLERAVSSTDERELLALPLEFSPTHVTPILKT